MKGKVPLNLSYTFVSILGINCSFIGENNNF